MAARLRVGGVRVRPAAAAAASTSVLHLFESAVPERSQRLHSSVRLHCTASHPLRHGVAFRSQQTGSRRAVQRRARPCTAGAVYRAACPWLRAYKRNVWAESGSLVGWRPRAQPSLARRIQIWKPNCPAAPACLPAWIVHVCVCRRQSRCRAAALRCRHPLLGLRCCRAALLLPPPSRQPHTALLTPPQSQQQADDCAALRCGAHCFVARRCLHDTPSPPSYPLQRRAQRCTALSVSRSCARHAVRHRLCACLERPLSPLPPLGDAPLTASLPACLPVTRAAAAAPLEWSGVEWAQPASRAPCCALQSRLSECQPGRHRRLLPCPPPL